jgi:AraC-like DNA-binding protein
MSSEPIAFISEHPHARVPAHRHQHAYAALILKGGYAERGPDGVWLCEENDIVIHPRFHMHGNDIALKGARVLNILLPDSPETAEYRVVQVADPATLADEPCVERLTETLSGAAVKSSAGAGDWRDAFAGALAADPLQSVAELAQRFGLSAEHASRAFRDMFAMTPVAFRSEHRLRTAVRAVAAGAPLADIAHACGYADQAHMTRAFVSALGLTPARVRAAS